MVKFIIVLNALLQMVCNLSFDHKKPCNHSEECIDRRMVCVMDENNATVCLCDRFHEWTNTTYGCVQRHNVILNTTTYVYDGEDMDWYQDRIFFAQKIAGFFVLSVCVLAIICVTSYCWYIRKKDNDLQNMVRQMRKSTKSCSSSRI